ncbi:hypothetical protein Bca52824_046917 [Brassica carinata]|uniref:Uncharacterized protein n=1 Tax=Brassica carinata TaxID=52824 RepID=A0A8X7RI41_BRACI|nr:hypothetical protein Bca52824_046917 [Brassica carinata]
MGLYKFFSAGVHSYANWVLVLVVPSRQSVSTDTGLRGQQRPQINESCYLESTRVINFVEKDISEMWPKWDSEVEDLPAENIIKVMYERRPWKWTMDCWEVTGYPLKINSLPLFIESSSIAVIESGFAMEICSRYDADANTLLR